MLCSRDSASRFNVASALARPATKTCLSARDLYSGLFLYCPYNRYSTSVCVQSESLYQQQQPAADLFVERTAFNLPIYLCRTYHSIMYAHLLYGRWGTHIPNKERLAELNQQIAGNDVFSGEPNNLLAGTETIHRPLLSSFFLFRERERKVDLLLYSAA